MHYQQAWQTVLEQLKTEMPRAGFESWVQDTQALSFESGVLTVGTRNTYARQWLEDRVRDDAQNMLLNLLQAETRVEFVVAGMNAPDEALEEEELADVTDRVKHIFTAEPVNATRYQEEVRPERVVLLDGYALRLMEHGDLTPKEMSLWVGFRQAVYQRWKNGSGTVKNVPYWEVLRFASMSRASYFRETSGVDSLAGGLVEVVPVPGAAMEDRRFDNAKRYRVQMAPRLTRRDCAVLESILLADVCIAATKKEAHDVALATLNRLAEAEPGEYLNQPTVQVGSVWPKSMHEIVRRVLDIKGDIPADLHAAAEKVFDRILRGFGKVLITHYFLKNAAHKFNLTHPQLWSIIALRDRSWYDHETRTQKEFAILPRGLDELGGWVGVDRKTVKRWLMDPAFTTFVQMGDMSTVELPESWNRHTTIFLVRQDEPLEEEFADKMSTDAGQSEHRSGTKRVSGLDKMSTDSGQNEHLLNNLIKPLLNPNKPQESPPVQAAQKNDPPVAFGGAGSRSFWDFDFLMSNNHVNPGSKKNLLRTNKSKWGRNLATLSAGFVSWILYAYSPEGVGVKDPLGLAIIRLNENAHAGAHGGFDKLAQLTPFRLRALFDADFVGAAPGDSLEDSIYQANFSRLEMRFKQELYRRLFGFTEANHAAPKET